MSVKLLLFVTALLSVNLFPILPAWQYCLFCIPFMILATRFSWYQYILSIAAGFCVGILSGHQLLKHQLSADDSGKEFILTGYVTNLPKHESRQLRFWVDVNSLQKMNGQTITHHLPQRVQLSWYINQYKPMPSLKIGEMWQWRVRLQRPRSMVNPAGFDYQVWLMRQGIGAVGYVIGNDNKRYQVESSFKFTYWVNQQRYHLQQWVKEKSDSAQKGILVALLIGDSSLVNRQDWLTMQQTGTNHLIAISGLHVGFLAIVGFYFGGAIGRLGQFISISWPAQYFAYIGAILFASFYSALAGFNIPTVRTLLMLSLFYWMCLSRKETHVVSIFCVALACVVIMDPLAAFDVGFWLSFGAVALLIFYFSGRKKLKPESGQKVNSIKNLILVYLDSQWLMLIGLTIPLLLLTSSISLLAPIANALAIPVITFFVVPLLLLSAGVNQVFPSLSEVLLRFSEWGLENLLEILNAFLIMADGKLNPVISLTPEMSIWIGFCTLLILMPRGFFPRGIAFIAFVFSLWVAYIYPKPNQPDLRLLVMDVGQGTAIVIQVKEKTLVYDTGAAFSDNFDAGSGIVAPYLRSEGVTKIDKLIVSHNDQDHAGGLSGLSEAIKVDQLLLGQYRPIFSPTAQQQMVYAKANSVQSCHEYPQWQWHQVRFEFLHWPLRQHASANNYSCVLVLDYQGEKIVLPGDLEKEVEQQLLQSEKLPRNVQILLAGHHGSLSSSTPKFVDHLRPKQVVYSAGFQNRYGHPNINVRQRFQSINSVEFNTATDGALAFQWQEGRQLPVFLYRRDRKRYWFNE